MENGIFKKMTKDVVFKKRQRETDALIEKWRGFGLLEGLGSEREEQNMAVLYENQAIRLLKEASSMGAGDVQGYSSVAFPIVRRVFGNMVAQELVSVQSLDLPSGLIFFLDFTFGDEKGANPTAAGEERFGQKYGGVDSIYGTNRVGSGVIDGVKLVDPVTGADLSGPYHLTSTYSSPTGSLDLVADGAATFKGDAFALNEGSLTDAQRQAFSWDRDLLLIAADPATSALNHIAQISVNKAAFEALDMNFDDLQAISALSASLAAETLLGAGLKIVRRLSKLDPADTSKIILTIVGPAASIPLATVLDAVALGGVVPAEFPIRDNLSVVPNELGSIVGGDFWGLENQAEMPEIDIKIDSTSIETQTKKLKVKWSQELEHDIHAYHSIDAQLELTQIMSELATLEIDQEILKDLVQGAAKTGNVRYWSRSPGLFLNRLTGVEVGSNTKAPDFTGNVSEWYETLLETVNDVSAEIHKKTLRGGANFLVCGPRTAVILEATNGFAATVTADVEKGVAGLKNAGQISKKFDIYVTPYFPDNIILIGRKGNSFLETGYVYAPYVPLQTSPVIFDPETHQPRKSVATRYGKKMIRPDMYGLVIIRGMDGESGAA